MTNIPGYDRLLKIYESSKSAVFRASRQDDTQPVVLKVLKNEYPSFEELTQYKQEYEIISSLNQSEAQGVIQVYGIEEYENKLVIVFEDFGGESLDRRIAASERFTLKEFLVLAIKIAEALGVVHGANVIHKDINPSNIAFNGGTGQLKIIDFGNSTRLSRENPTLRNPEVIEGTLAYISPEQTGRMNRSIDYRTDYYSMGASFYELLTGTVPFDSADPIELIHCHMARWPVPPQDHRDDIPEILSKIVLKLLSKNAEERYQSAIGIISDLKQCLDQLETTGVISDFLLASQDRGDRFHIPEKLYGRVQEIKTLIGAFGRAAGGKNELMLVSGSAGIGKTALVREIYRPLTKERAYFISGKFDQYHRNVPYNHIIQAFRELVRQLLSESRERLSIWRETILNALGSSGRVIIDVIPELEMIIGPQPPLPELSPSVAQNRFHIALERFINALHSPEQPLVIFLDDLQWADSASLKLIQVVMTAYEKGHLFVIGAYREEDVDRAHPLTLTLNEIRKTSAIVNHIRLSSLTLPDVNQFVGDTFSCLSEEVKSLAGLVLAKTDGNPFFMGEFLRSLYTEKFINFDLNKGCWSWDFEQIRKAEMTDNVVDLMVDKIKGMDRETQEVLKLASCIGSPFDLNTLAIVYQKRLGETASALWEAIAEGLLCPIGDAYRYVELGMEDRAQGEKVEYMFCHDRIQQAAYSLIPEDERRVVHWQVGQLLLKKTPLDKRERKIFNIVNQLNQGVGLVTSPSDRDEVARLNLLAGRKAKASAAYQSMRDYIKVGLDLLPDDTWEEQYDLTLSLYTEAVEAAYVCTFYDEMEGLAKIVLQRAKTLLDKMKVYEAGLLAYTGQNRPQETVNYGLKVLKLLGIRLPRPNSGNILLSLLKTRLALTGKSHDDLIRLPEMTDPHRLAATRILAIASSAAFHSDPKMLALIEIKLVNLSLKYGNASESPFAYACYGFFLCGALKQIDRGYGYGQFALRLLAQSKKKEFECRTIFTFNVTTRHWKEHVKETLDALLKTYQIGLETGDIEYAAFSGLLYCLHSLVIGKELTGLEEEMAYYSDAIAKLNQEPILNIHRAHWQMVLNLIHQTKDPCRLAGESYNEIEMLPRNLEANELSTLFGVYISKLMLCFLFGAHGEAVASAENAEKYLSAVQGIITVTLLSFYGSLARLAAYSEANHAQQRQYAKKVSANQKKLKKWADSAPMNHLHKYYLVEAERERVLGRDSKSVDLYDRAIDHAKENGFIQEEALACELAGQYWLGRGKEHIARPYMRRAHYRYQQWGAKRKVQDLEERYSDLLARSYPHDDASAVRSTSTYGTYSESGSRLIDFGSMMKASQAISGEIALDTLLKRFMTLVMENAGAEKGALILKEKGRFVIEAQTEPERPEKTRIASVPLSAGNDLSAAIVQYVVRVKESLVLNDAAKEGAFTLDDYVLKKKPKSILCIPIVHKGAVTGVLYLENTLIAGAFTPDRVEVLQLLASQAAISIENARFYNMLEESEKNYRSLYENAIEGIFQMRADGRLLSANPSLARIMGYKTPEEMVSAIADSPKFSHMNRDDFNNLDRILRNRSRIAGFEARMFRKDGTAFWASLSARVNRHAEGKIIYYEGSVIDITERREKETAEREREAAEAANRAKSEFLASMSHEIRTPMNAILGMADLLWESPLNPEQKEYVRIFRNAGQGLLDLINDILDLSKVEAGQMSLEETDLDLLDMVEKVCEVMAVKAHEKGLELLYRIDPQTPRYLVGDPTRLRQILVNLVGNAVKFTHEGEIMIAVSQERQGEISEDSETEAVRPETLKLLFSVQDTGIGISEALKGKIFESFTQADTSTTRQYGGTGLGLAICSRLVDVMGGRIWVESRQGKGSTFFFTAPFRLQHETKVKSKPVEVDFKGLRVLVVDDNAVNRLILRETLIGWETEVTVAESGEEGLQAMSLAEQTGTPFQLVLLDYRMPGMNGFETAEEMKKRFGSLNHTVMLLTSDTTENHFKRARDLGIAASLVKPVKREQLKEAIWIALSEKPPEAEGVQKEKKTEETEKMERARILLVEDNKDNQLLFDLFLKKTPHRVDIAENGKIGVEKYKAGVHDLVFMDMEMPVMDGYEATRRIRKWERENNLKPVPIIALTAHALKGKEVESLEAGCTSHMTKPFKKKDLLETIIKHSEPRIK